MPSSWRRKSTSYKSNNSISSSINNLNQNYDNKSNNQSSNWLSWIFSIWRIKMSLIALGLSFSFIFSFLHDNKDINNVKNIINDVKIINFQDNPNPKIFEEIINQNIPTIIRGVMMKRDRISILKSLELGLGGRSKLIMQMSKKKEFTYHTSQKAWNLNKNEEKLKVEEEDDDEIEWSLSDIYDLNLNDNDDNNDNDNEKYIYSNYNFDTRQDNLLVSHLVPILLHIPRILNNSPLLRLWVSSKGTIALPHYDLENNLFFQLSGEKTFTISPPSSYPLYNPYPFLHSQWRQSQKKELISATAVKESSKTCHNNSDSSSSNDNNSNYSDNVVPVWDIKLESGDVLYLPALYFHSVESGAESTSLNAWLGSQEAAVSRDLASVSLPPMSTGNTSRPVLAAMISLVVKTYSNKNYDINNHGNGNSNSAVITFANHMIARYESTCNDIRSGIVSLTIDNDNNDGSDSDSDGYGSKVEKNEGNDKEYCNIRSVRTAIRRPRVIASSKRLSGILQNFDTAVADMLFMDYVEELMDAMFSGECTPCMLMNFVQKCLIESHEKQF